MGLFRKKPKASTGQQIGGGPAPADVQSRLATAAKPSEQNNKAIVEPADFLALRAELIEMKARLDASEQARGLVEARLTALDETAATFSVERGNLHEITDMVLQLQGQIAERPAVSTPMPPPPPTSTGPDPETLARLADLQHRIANLDHVSQRFGELDYLHQRLAGIESLHQQMNEPDDIHQRLEAIDGLAAQVQQLNARVAAQADIGDQLSGLRERMTLLTDGPRDVDDDIRLQLQELGERLRVGEALHGQVDLLAERVTVNDAEAQAVREHMAQLDQRLTNVSTELANQLSELGSDIDGLGQRLPEAGQMDEIVDALRGGQVKLANEQARYEIAFREDLAALAEMLRKGRSAS